MKLTFEKVISLAVLSTRPGLSLPLSRSSSKLKQMYLKIIRYIGFINLIIEISVLLRTSIKYSNELSIFIPCTVHSFACLCAETQTIVCEVNAKRLQLLIAELRNYSRKKEPRVQKVLQNYVDRYATFYVAFVLWVYFTASTFVISPIIISEPLPTRAEYPLPVDYLPVRCILYLHLTIAAYQTAGQISLNAFCALLYWFISIRYDILSEDFKMVTNMDELKKCIIEHQRLLALTKEIISGTRFIVASELLFGTLRIVFSALTFMRPQPMAERAQYLVVTFTMFLTSFASIWPADSILSLNDRIIESCYDSRWWEQSKAMRTNVLIIMTNCQQSLALSVSCILPSASLVYFRAYVSTAVSYFTALHVMFEGEADDTS